MPKVRKGHRDKEKEKKKHAKEKAESVRSDLIRLAPDQVDMWVQKNAKDLSGIRTVLLELTRVVVFLRDYTDLVD